MMKRNLVLFAVPLMFIHVSAMSSSRFSLTEDLVSYLSKRQKPTRLFSVFDIRNNGELIAKEEMNQKKMVDYLGNKKKTLPKKELEIIDVDNEHDVLFIKK